MGNRRYVLPMLREHLHLCQPDIVFLQEVYGQHQKHQSRFDTWKTESQFEYLAEDLWPHFAYGKNAIYQEGHHGNAILSKIPFIQWENINVSRYQKASRSLLHGVLTMDEHLPKLHVICLHLGLFESERKSQINILCERLWSHVPENEPLLIAGDFNDWRRNAEKHLQESLNLKEIFTELTGAHARSFPGWFPVLRVDRIYYRNLKPLSCKILTGTPWNRLSDHTPLLGNFELS